MQYAINGSKLGQFSVPQTGHFHLNSNHRLMGYTCDCVKDYTMLYVGNGSQLEKLKPLQYLTYKTVSGMITICYI